MTRLGAGAALLAAWAILLPRQARADDTSRVAAATLLFDEGVKAMDAGRLEEACPKLAKSQSLAPSGGTLLALGDCYERTGRVASAWVAFREAANRAASAGKNDAHARALEQAARLEARLPRLTVHLAMASGDVEVRRDGVLLRSDELDVATPIDPGKHEIVASVPEGAAAWSRVIDAVEGRPTTITVPELDRKREPPSAAEVVPPANHGSAQRTVGVIVAGAGLATAAIGGVFGVLAKSANDAADDHCIQLDPRRCDAEGLSLVSDAKARALTATVLFIFGGAALAGGAVLFFTAPSGSRGAMLQLKPEWGASAMGGSATVRW